MTKSEEISRRKVIKTDGTNRIAIIGGGICGVTAAKAIMNRMKTLAPEKKLDIHIYEADPNSYESSDHKQQYGFQNGMYPSWKAATARNANSLVPAAAMHIMSQREDLMEIFRDSLLQIKLSIQIGSAKGRDFSTVPPYFGFSPFACLGLSASWSERKCFLNFVYHFVTTSLMTGEAEAKDRGKIMVQLASANRFVIDRESRSIFDEKSKKTVASAIGLQNGFISVHRTLDKAQVALKECEEIGEEAELLSKNEAILLEPKIADVPFTECYCVHRKRDQTGNCVDFIRSMIKNLQTDGVIFSNDLGAVNSIAMVEKLEINHSHKAFQITTNNGDVREYDRVILAAGIHTPLLASKLSNKIGLLCPIYPLKGYSLTVFTKPRDQHQNFLTKPLSFDNIYCSSVAPNMIRLAGFGEIVGFPKDGDYDKIGSGPGPEVLEKYAKRIFGADAVVPIDNSTLPCYRPLSPDDCPLVGRFGSIPGLYIHTGHGTLGWTTSLATASCVAQDVCDDILGQEERDEYILPDGTSIEKKRLSPERFKMLWNRE
jgi:D-amino-acid dehydrogenase